MYTREIREPKCPGNYYDLDKTRVKLFPNFTRHHLIIHINDGDDDDNDIHDN